MTRYAQHTITARVILGGSAAELGVKRATINLDDSWSPFIQGELVCSLPTDPAVLALVDPTKDARLSIIAAERVGVGGTLGDFTADWGAGTLGALFAGGTLGDITAAHFLPWNSDDGIGSRISLDVGIRERRIDHKAQELTVTFMSDEALLFDYALMSTSAETPGSTSVKTAAQFALAKIGATLDASSADALVEDAAALTWFPGTSGWDYIEGLTQNVGLRLWCDERRVWRLTARDTPAGAGTILSEYTDAVDAISRDGAWCDGVVVEYEWTDDADVRRTRRDIAGGSAASKIRRVNYSTPYPGKGTAKRILDRTIRRARVLELTALSDYDAYPNGPLTASTPNMPVQTGVVERVTFEYPAGLMRVVSRGLVDTRPAAWLLIPAGESWLNQPAGASWLTEQIGV